jgi:hypothetical protein
MFRIIYNSNPNNPLHLDHIGALGCLTAQNEKTFDNLNQAITFWFDCNSPITSLNIFKDALMKNSNISSDTLDEVLCLCECREENISMEEILSNKIHLVPSF